MSTRSVNDMLSIKKEIQHGSIERSLSVPYVQTGSVQAAIDQATEFLATNVKKFNEAA